ncbi:hypothetical protein HDU93_008523 [Gonapodya sp. JEL0774]|nr:hypothetical protein HDU93_008523 [Gonapodya sp. JEL0774]
MTRIQLAKTKGCDGLEYDNVDGYSNDSGFNLTKTDQLVYNRWLADTGHSLNLLVGLKNTLDLAVQLVSYFDFALLEQCVKYSECDMAKPFLDAGKAVFDVEYTDEGSTESKVCPITNNAGIDAQLKTLDLYAPRVMCRTNYTDLVTATVANTPSATSLSAPPGSSATSSAPSSATSTGGTGKAGAAGKSHGKTVAGALVGIFGAILVALF